MNMQHIHQRNLDLSALSVFNPLVWVVAALLVFVLFANWPAWFTAPAQAQSHSELSAAPTAAPAASYVSSDPSLPSAASVFGGRSYEVSPQIDTF